MSLRMILRTASAKNIMGDSITAPPIGEVVWLYDIVGRIAGHIDGSGKFGGEDKPWRKWLGSFGIVVLETGARYRASAAFLPEPAHSIVNAGYIQQSKSDEFVGLDIAFRVGVKGVKKRDGSHGYEYVTDALLKTGETDPIEGMFAQIARPALTQGKGVNPA